MVGATCAGGGRTRGGMRSSRSSGIACCGCRLSSSCRISPLWSLRCARCCGRNLVSASDGRLVRVRAFQDPLPDEGDGLWIDLDEGGIPRAVPGGWHPAFARSVQRQFGHARELEIEKALFRLTGDDEGGAVALG